MKKLFIMCISIVLLLSACSSISEVNPAENSTEGSVNYEKEKVNMYTLDSKIDDVVDDKIFEDWGKLIFPVNEGYYSGDTLRDLELTWYSEIDPDTTVEIVNYFKNSVESGKEIFYPIYSKEEISKEPDKANTGLFFFRGNPGNRFAICNAGGGFAYVGAMHDSFPHALELSKEGYNAFALIYRPDAQSACEDLARAISFVFTHAKELEVETDNYSLWGGSAGGRMAAWLGSYGTAYFGEDEFPKPAALILQYTGIREYSKNDPPTYACAGESDSIANWEIMKQRLTQMEKLGINTEFHSYEGLGHGFGIGKGTIAEGWIDDAIGFWEKQIL